MEGGERAGGTEGAEGATTAEEAEAPTDPLEEKRRELKRRRARLGEGAEEGAEAELLQVEEAMLELQVQQREVSALPRSDDNTVTKQEFRKRFTDQMKARGEPGSWGLRLRLGLRLGSRLGYRTVKGWVRVRATTVRDRSRSGRNPTLALTLAPAQAFSACYAHSPVAAWNPAQPPTHLECQAEFERSQRLSVGGMVVFLAGAARATGDAAGGGARCGPVHEQPRRLSLRRGAQPDVGGGGGQPHAVCGEDRMDPNPNPTRIPIVALALTITLTLALTRSLTLTLTLTPGEDRTGRTAAAATRALAGAAVRCRAVGGCAERDGGAAHQAASGEEGFWVIGFWGFGNARLSRRRHGAGHRLDA